MRMNEVRANDLMSLHHLRNFIHVIRSVGLTVHVDMPALSAGGALAFRAADPRFGPFAEATLVPPALFRPDATKW